MWVWLQRWYTRTARTLWWLFGQSPRLRALHFGYEKAGLAVSGEPIPWNADAVVIDALLDLASEAAGACRSDFRASTPGELGTMAVAVQPPADDGPCRVVFRLTPHLSGVVELYRRSRQVARLALPYLRAEDFLQNLRLDSPLVFARIGRHSVAARCLVEGQFSSLLACAVLRSPTSLLPIVGLGLTVEISSNRTGQTQAVPVCLAGAQVVGRQALLSAFLPRWPEMLGTWSVHWLLGGRLLGCHELRVISAQTLKQSLYVPKDQYLYQMKDTGTGDAGGRTNLLFRLASSEPGLAAVTPLEVQVHCQDGSRVVEATEEEVLVTDIPSLCQPVAVSVVDLQNIEAFEVSSGGRFMGSVRRSPTPLAILTSEGGFQAPADYDWSAVTEAELNEHLSRLTITRPS
jgi:hypothetical protein